MSTYEIDDEVVRAWLEKTVGPDVCDHDEARLAIALKGQVSLPLPARPFAVVRTNRGVFAHMDPSDGRFTWQDLTGVWFTPDNLGRVTEVLFEGVEEE